MATESEEKLSVEQKQSLGEIGSSVSNIPSEVFEGGNNASSDALPPLPAEEYQNYDHGEENSEDSGEIDGAYYGTTPTD